MTRSPVMFSGQQAASIARGFADRTGRSEYGIWACAIMPDHAHLVIRRHQYSIEQVVRSLRQRATQQLLEDGEHPFATERLPSGRLPSVWAQGFWKVFLFNDGDIRRSIAYVERNPVNAGLPPQRWSFVSEYDPS